MIAWARTVLRRTSVIAVFVTALATAGVVLAYFTAHGSGSATGSVGSLAAPTLSAPTPGAGTVSLSWTAVTPPASGTVKYYVTRAGGTVGGTCPSSAATATTNLSCTDSGLSKGTYTYTVTAVWQSWSATSTAQNASVASGAATALVFTTQPVGGVTEGTNFGTQPIVKVEDSSGNVATSDNGTVALAINSYSPGNGGTTQGSLSCSNPGGLTATASSGVVTFFGCKITGPAAAGTYTLKATRTGLATATSSNVTISADTANKLVFTTQPVGGVTEGTNFGAQPIAKVEDSSGNVVTSDNGSVTLAINSYTASNGGTTQGTLSCSNTGGLTATASSGVATFSGCQITGTAAAGTYTLKATRTGLTTATSGNVTINADTANKLVFTAQPVGGVTEGSAFGTSPQVSVEDSSGNVVTSDNGSVTLAINSYTAGNGGTTQGSLTCTNTGGLTAATSSGLATFSGCQITGSAAAGTYTLKATRTGLTSTGASSNVTINAGTASQLVFTSQPVGGVTEGTNLATQPVVKVEDSNGNVVISDNGHVTLAINSYSPGNGGTTQGTLSCSNTGFPTVSAASGVVSFSGCQVTGTAAAGTYTLKATRTGLTTATSGNVAINADTASQLVFTAQPVGGVTEGTNFATQPVVKVEDSSGNVVTSDNGSVTLAINSYTAGNGGTTQGTLSCTNTGGLTATASSGVATFSGCKITGTAAAGTYTLAAARTGLTGTGASSNVTINAGTPLGLSLNIVTAPNRGGPLSCGTISSNYACSWTGANNGSGLTAAVSFVDSFGNATVESASSQSTINLSAPAKGTLSPATLTVPAGQTTTSGSFTLTMSGSNTAAISITFGSSMTLGLSLG